MTVFKQYLASVGEVGQVAELRGSIVWASGLAGARIGEKVVFEQDQLGMVEAILPQSTQILLLSARVLAIGTMVVRSAEPLRMKVSTKMVGRVVDPLGEPIDGRGKISDFELKDLEHEAAPIIDRVRIDESLETGVTIVDLLIPLGRGQRELVIGDGKSGKTTFLIQALARQVQLGKIGVYCAIGKRRSDLAAVLDRLRRLGAFGSTVVVAAPAGSPSSLIYLAPFSAFAISEYFRQRGRDVLLVLDELGRHAKYVRELAILAKKMPGRDGYPGDVFYTHAHLMERAGRILSARGAKARETISLKIKGPTASISCLPVAETQGADLTGYIQTNLMAMTDGHIFFDVNLFQEGRRPAINTALSVSRVGKQTQTTVERELALTLRQILFDYARAREVAKFGVELLATTQEKLAMGERLLVIFEQSSITVIPKVMQLLLVGLLMSDFWKDTSTAALRAQKEQILAAGGQGRLKQLIAQLEAALDLGSKKKFLATCAAWQEKLVLLCKLSAS